MNRRCSARCSVTITVGSGTSNTCRTVVPATSRSDRVRSQARHRTGRCVTTSSGSGTCDSVNPGEPGCLPCRRPIARRAARLAFSARSDFAPPGSLDGGLDEFDEFRPKRLLQVGDLALELANSVQQLLALGLPRRHHRNKITLQHDDPSPRVHPTCLQALARTVVNESENRVGA